MQRHPHHEEHTPQHETIPLFSRHISLGQESFEDERGIHGKLCGGTWTQKGIRITQLVIPIVIAFIILMAFRSNRTLEIVPIEKAREHMLDIGGGLTLWYRVWGNRKSGIPILFVHGGPGNAIADYDNGNKRFFDSNKFLVIEVDQRGTGRSQPSLRDDCENWKYYKDISIDKMSHDFELVRRALNVEKWLVFGGSWGSTLAIDYTERYPQRALGLIVRGIWLNTRPEFDAIFIREPYLDNKKRLAEFDTWLELAHDDVLLEGEAELDNNDGERFFRIYERMIQRCDQNAIWRWFAWENNMMEEDPANLVDPFTPDMEKMPEATSVAFFENSLFLHGTFDQPMDLLAGVHHLKGVNTWICQGLSDEVCPAQYGGAKLAQALVDIGVPTRAQFLDAGHEDTDPLIARCLKESVEDFLKTMKEQKT
jgi:proline iminopeptidase